jgi:hypothetical protein
MVEFGHEVRPSKLRRRIRAAYDIGRKGEMSLLEPPVQLLQLLRDALPATSQIQEEKSNGNSSENWNEDGTEEILGYVAFLAAGLSSVHEWDTAVWTSVLEPYLSQSTRIASLFSSNEDWPYVIEKYRTAVERAMTVVDDADSYGGDDNEEVQEVCNVRFNLAYGGKILLHQTKLRLLRGRRYALVGQNGGKLQCCMRSNRIDSHRITRHPI